MAPPSLVSVSPPWVSSALTSSSRVCRRRADRISWKLTILFTDIVPVIMAGIIGIYGLVVSVLISDSLSQEGYALYTGFIQLGAGLAVGLAGLAAGFAIGIVGDAGVRGTAQQPRLFVGMILILIFAEVLGKLPFLATLTKTGLTTCPRSLRLDCCSAHELQGHPQHDVLSWLSWQPPSVWADKLYPFADIPRTRSWLTRVINTPAAIHGLFNVRLSPVSPVSATGSGVWQSWQCGLPVSYC